MKINNTSLESIEMLEQKIQAYWNMLGARERIDLVKKATGVKMEVNQVVNLSYPTKEIESFLEANPDEITPKFQIWVKETKESDWKKIANPTFDREYVDYVADGQFFGLKAFAVGVVDLLRNKLVVALNH